MSDPAGATPPTYTPRPYRFGRWRHRGIGFGIALVVVGILLLLQNLGLLWWWRWDIFWPLAIIAFGIWIIVRRTRW